MSEQFDWKKLANMPRGTKEYEDLLNLTEREEEHPNWYEDECYCKLCTSYAG